jgi:hypothetical protein
MAEGRKQEENEESEEVQTIHANEGNISECPEGGENDLVEHVARGSARYESTRLESFSAMTKSLIIRAVIMYFIVSLLRLPATIDPETDGFSPTKILAFNMFEDGTVMDLYVYLSEKETFTEFMNPEALIWSEKGIIYGDWTSGPQGDGTRAHSVEIKTSEAVQNNGSLYLHVYVTRRGKSPDPAAGKEVYVPHQVAYSKKLLNKYKRLRHIDTINLTSATAEEFKRIETIREEVVSHWHPNLTINLVTDQTNWIQGYVPPPLDKNIEFLPGADRYKPVIYLNDFWNTMRDYQPINKATKVLQLSLTYQPLSLFEWQIYSAQTMRNKRTGNTFVDEWDEVQDSFKQALLETLPYLLALIMVKTLLHSVFELLAFRNSRKSLECLSVLSVFFTVFQSLLVLFYVFDINAVVKISFVVGLCIQIWKIHKDFNINHEARIFGLIPKGRFSYKGSYEETSTREYDELAFR